MPRVAENLDDRARWQGAGGSNKSTDLDDRPRTAEDPILRAHLARRREASVAPSLQSESRARGLAPPRIIIATGGLIFAASFVAALLLIKPTRPPTAAMMTLAASTVTDLKTLMGAVKVAGLKGSPDVKGAIEEIARVDDDQVKLKGWAVEIGNSQEPVTVMAFVDGRNGLTMEASGRREEAMNAAGLAATDATNVAFAGRLRCGKGRKLIVVAVARNDLYGHFGSRLCP